MTTCGKFVLQNIAAICLALSAGVVLAADTHGVGSANEGKTMSGYSLQLSPGNHVIIVNGTERRLLRVDSKGGSRVKVEAAQGAVPYVDISLALPEIRKSI